MKQELNTLLDEAAAGARNYADSRRAVASARRRRYSRTTGAAALVIAVLLGGSLAWNRAHSMPAAPARSHSFYPPQISPPKSAELLPADRAVGVASFLYSPCIADVDRCPEYLVMPDGRQYVMPPRADRIHPTDSYTLSPDGRFLGWDAGDRYRIRDLKSKEVRDVEVPGGGRDLSAAGWSPNSRYLLVVARDKDSPRTYVRVTMDDSSAPITIAHDDTPVDTRDQVGGVLDNGDIVLANPEGNPVKIRLRIVDAATSREKHSIELDRGGLTKDFEVADSQFLLAQCGCRISFPLWANNSHWARDRGHDVESLSGAAVQTGLLQFDPVLPSSVHRHDNPEPEVDRKDGEKWKFTSMWEVKADLAEGMVALNRRSDRVEIVLVKVGGSHNVVTRLPAGVVVLVRSATTAIW